MSLILKGIDIPKEGEWLEVIIKPTKEVIIDTIRYRDNALLKTEYESAIQIPKGHGDIKDEAEIIKRLEEKENEPKYQHDMDDWWVGIIDAETEVNRAPTILESEGTNEYHIERD